MKDCPKCKLVNPDSAVRCDCGYDFPSGSMQASYIMNKQANPKDFFWYVAIAIICSPLIPILDHFGRFELARPACFALMTILLVIKVCRDIRRRWWFWVTIVAVAALHVPLILYIPWTTKWVPPVAILPICIADLLVILGIVNLAERLFGKKRIQGLT